MPPHRDTLRKRLVQRSLPLASGMVVFWVLSEVLDDADGSKSAGAYLVSAAVALAVFVSLLIVTRLGD